MDLKDPKYCESFDMYVWAEDQEREGINRDWYQTFSGWKPHLLSVAFQQGMLAASLSNPQQGNLSWSAIFMWPGSLNQGEDFFKKDLVVRKKFHS